MGKTKRERRALRMIKKNLATRDSEGARRVAGKAKVLGEREKAARSRDRG